MLTIYKASAGSGKTYTLAYEYVKLLLGVKMQTDGSYRLNSPRHLGGRQLDARHRHILAITFTNKATEEMKSRILKELASLASGHGDSCDDSPYAPGLVAEYGCSRDELRETASRALHSLLFDYHHFNVSTIDSFFQTVLRAFAREVDRQGDYGVELDDEYAVGAGIGLMLDDLNYGNPPRRKRMMRWIRDYAMSMVEDGKDGNVFNRSGKLLRDLTRYVKKMGSEVFRQSSDRVLEYLDDPGRIRQFVKDVDERVSALRRDMSISAKKLLDDFGCLGFDRRVVPDVIWKIVDSAAAMDDIDLARTFEPFTDKAKTVKKAMGAEPMAEGKTFYVKKYAPDKGRTLPPDSFSDALARWLEACQRVLVEIHALEKIKDACPNLEFLGFAWHYIGRFREENNLILLSDTHDLLQRIIGESDTPFVYERVGVALRNFLIDEFQDTSHMQWHNLKPLLADSLATGCDNLIIGDEKQAIYRFRNSDSSLLHHVVADEDFPDNHVIRGNLTSENTNYRSAAGIVRFNNALFSRLSNICGVEGYENTIQAVSPKKHDLGSYVRVYDTSGLAKVNDCPAELDITAREILRQHESGYQWSDIAVLVRRRAEAVAMVDYLLKHYPQIRVLSDEALLLRNSSSVKLIVSMLKLVDKSYSAMSDARPTDQAGTPAYASNGDIAMMISRFEYYRSEGFEGPEALRLALEPAGTPPGQCLSESIVDIRSAHPSGLVSLVETIIEKIIPESRRKSEYAYLTAFQDEVINYCSLYNPSIHSFLDWWDEASEKLAISSGAGQDAVSVMTVHKSKGLQWSCVHVPFGDWELAHGSDSVWLSPGGLGFVDQENVPPLVAVDIDRLCALEGSPLAVEARRNLGEQLVDNLNTAYVAYTRPERELSVCFASHKAMGAKVFEALTMNDVSGDPDLCEDLREGIRAVVNAEQPGLMFVSGSPTSPADGPADAGGDTSTIAMDHGYSVFFRDDTAALTSIDDAISDAGDIMLDHDDVPTSKDMTEDLLTGSAAENRSRAAERGLHLHGLMADIDGSADIDSAIWRLKQRSGLDDQTLHGYKSIISSAMDGAGRLALRWFDPEARVLKEQSIYLPESDSTFRPDRIVMAQDGTVDVVDYKFTSEPLESHKRQVGQYVRVLQAMGYVGVNGYLWYPELNIVQHVNNQMTNDIR